MILTHIISEVECKTEWKLEALDIEDICVEKLDHLMFILENGRDG